MEYSIEIKYKKQKNLLSELSEKYGSDKGFCNSNFMTKNGWQYHTYTDIYDLILKNKKDQVLNFFEMGIGTTDTSFLYNMGPNGTIGASLRMWKEYFPNASIYGADIDPKCLFIEDRIFTYVADQLSSESLTDLVNTINKKFDVIVDDGLHEYESNICMYENMIDSLNKDGFYIIEDIKNNILWKYEEYFNEKNENFYSVKLNRPYSELGDNCIIVIYR
jgi:hypothetical protein